MSVYVDLITFDIDAIVIIALSLAGNSDLMVLIRAAIKHKDSLVVILLPREDLSRRVDQILITHRIITQMDLRVPPVQDQAATQLRDLDITIVDGIHRQFIRHRLDGIILGMPRDIKLRRLRRRRRDRNGLGIREIQRPVVTIGLEERGGHVEEVRLQLDLAVLLAPELALLGDLRAVVVGREALRVAQVAPVGAAKGHVDVVDGGAEGVVVLVEDALKLHVGEEGAVLEASLAPVLEATPLELQVVSDCVC